MWKRKTFTKELKREVVRLLEFGKKSAAQLAKDVGVRRNQLYKWKEQIDDYGKVAFPGYNQSLFINLSNLVRLKKLAIN